MTAPSSEKIIRDPVHGNIRIPNWVCQEIVDTDIFQRLRFVEQSSIRLLYPGARHDRFVHSLGVFHVASKVFAYLRKQFVAEGFSKREIERFQNTFIVAALLHDCAHSPFSHTGEELAKDYCNPDIEEFLTRTIRTKAFQSDFYDPDGDRSFHTHEMASAYVGCEAYAKVFRRHNIDREQFARMIIGLRNSHAGKSSKRAAYNCLILLLNGFIVDVDRLDYLLRDTWASGVCNSSVDIDRLIAGLRLDLKNGRVKVHFKSLSSMVNAVTARDFIYTWILPHHKVSYANELLTRAIKALVTKMAKGLRRSEAEIGCEIFSPQRMLRSCSVKIGTETISLPTDGDLIYLMKKYIPDNEFVQAYLSRKKEFVSLWKNYAEFSHVFSVERYNEEILSEPRFWNVFASEVIQYCKRCGGIISTDVQCIKQTQDEMLRLDIVSDQKTDARFDPSSLFKKDGRRKFYIYVFLRNERKAARKKILADLHKLFRQSVDAYRHR